MDTSNTEDNIAFVEISVLCIFLFYKQTMCQNGLNNFSISLYFLMSARVIRIQRKHEEILKINNYLSLLN